MKISKKIQSEVSQMHDKFSSLENASVSIDNATKEFEDMKSVLEACKIAVVNYMFDI